MEISAHVNKPQLPTPNLCRLVEILLDKARRRKEYHSNSATVLGEHDTDRDGSTDERFLQTPSNNSSLKLSADGTVAGQGSETPEHDVQESVEVAYTRFKGKTLDHVSLADLTAEFRALTVAQERESRRNLGLEHSPANDASQRRLLKSDDADLLALASPEMRMTWFSEERFVQQNTAGSSQLGSKDLGNRAIFGRDAAADLTFTKSKALPEENLFQKDLDNAAKLSGHPLIKAEAQHTSGLSTPSPPVQMTQLVWVRLANNQLVMAQVPVVSQSPAGIAEPVQAQAHRVSAPPAAPAQPVAPAKPSWTTLAAVSPEEHKQMIGERLCTQVQQMYPGLTNKITGMLLEMDNKELLRLLESPEMLKNTVNDAVKILQQRVMMTPRLTVELLQPFPSAQQKQILGERLFPQIQTLHPNQAGKITGMLLTLDNQGVLQLLEDPEMLKNKAEEAVIVLLQAHQQQLLAQEVPGTESLIGDVRREDLQMWDFCARQSQAGSHSGEQLLTDHKKKSIVGLREYVQDQKTENDGVWAENDRETQLQGSGAAGEQQLLCENVPKEETLVQGVSKQDVSAAQSVSWDFLQTHFPRDGFPGTRALATDAPEKRPQIDDTLESHSLINGLETMSVSEAIPGRQSLKDDMKTQSLVAESCNAYLARESFTETDLVSSSIYNTPEMHLSIHDLKPQPLTGNNVVTQSQTAPAEQPVPDAAPGKQLPVTNISSKPVNASMLEEQVRDTILGQLSVTENIPETVSPTEDILGRQLATTVGDVSKQQAQARDVSENQALSGRTLEALPQTLEQKSQFDDCQVPTQAAELQKEKLREQLLPVVEGMYPGLGGEICSIILTGDMGELSVMMTHSDTLKAKVAEAVSVLKARKAQQICEQGALLQSMYLQQQKQMVGQQLLSLIYPAYPKLATQITGLLLEREHVELLQMLQMPQVLNYRVGEAVRTLQAHLLKSPLTAEALDLFPAPLQKQILADCLLPLIQNYHPDHAQQITAMILSLDNSRLIQILDDPEVLKGIVENAVRLLPQVLAGNGTQTAEAVRNEECSDPSTKDKEADSTCRTSDQAIQEDNNPFEKPADHVSSFSAVDSPCAESPVNANNRQNDITDEPTTLNLNEGSLLEQEHASLKSEGDVIKKVGDIHGFSEAAKQSSNCEDSQVASNTGQGVQGDVVHLTQGDLMQCGMLTQQGSSTDVFEAVAHIQQQKQAVGQQLLSLIYPAYPKLAPQITGLLLEREHVELLQMLQMPQVLNYRVGEAVRILQAHVLKSPLTAEALDLFPAPMQKEMLGEQVFVLVQRLQPELAGKITGMLLDLDNTELIHVLNNPVLLQMKVGEASAMLYLFHRDGEKSKTEEAASCLEGEATTSVPQPDKITSDHGETTATVCSHEEE